VFAYSVAKIDIFSHFKTILGENLLHCTILTIFANDSDNNQTTANVKHTKHFNIMAKMKRILLLVALAMAGSQSLLAQENLFNHVAVGASIGTEGYGFELATPVTNYLALRAGMSMLPKVKVSGDVDIDSNSRSFSSKKATIEGKLNKVDFKFLVDFYPFPAATSFRLTVGAYIGSSKLINVYNTNTFLDESEWGVAGVKLGDYRVVSDDKGNINADVKVKKFKPYVGLGFGRAVPKRRLSFNFDLGVQFWGTPGVWTNTLDDFGRRHYGKLQKGDIKNDDADKAFDILSKIKVYPVISLRLNGRIL